LIALLRSRREARVHPADEIEREPYPGALPFTEDLAGLFFGSESDIERVLSALQSLDYVVVAGASSVGKTSLIRAGVVPRIRSQPGLFGQSEPWEIQWIDLSAPQAIDDVNAAPKAKSTPVL